MRPAVVVVCVLAGCGFSNRVDTSAIDIDAPSPDACIVTGTWWNTQYAHRFPIAISGAPAAYTARIDASAVLALSMANGNDLRVVVDHATELDRILDGGFVEFRVPASGAVSIYVADATSTAPPQDPTAIYAWAESFDMLAVNGDGTPRFTPQTPANWRVVDDGGNRIYRATGAGRHPAPIAGMTAAHVDIRARMRIGPGGIENHDGLLVRASTAVPAMLDGFVGQLLENSEYSRIAEYIDGVSPPVERGTFIRPVDRATWYALRLRAIGTTIELHVDGVLEVTTNLGTANGTILGLFAFGNDVDYDDIRVRRLVDPEPAMTIGAREDLTCQ